MRPAGSLDRLIDIRGPVEVADAVGGVSTTWDTLSTVWASREDIGGRELFRSGVAADFQRRYEIRDPGYPMDGRMRLRDPATTGQEFEISHIAKLEGRGVGFELLVRAVDETGIVGQ